MLLYLIFPLVFQALKISGFSRLFYSFSQNEAYARYRGIEFIKLYLFCQTEVHCSWHLPCVVSTYLSSYHMLSLPPTPSPPPPQGRSTNTAHPEYLSGNPGHNNTNWNKTRCFYCILFLGGCLFGLFSAYLHYRYTLLCNTVHYIQTVHLFCSKAFIKKYLQLPVWHGKC